MKLSNIPHKKFFTHTLLAWFESKKLTLETWKLEKDPYKIWLREIMLQQTRIDQGIPYYYRFINKYPDVHQLADSNEVEVYRLWQGLGYYNRCRNLIATAKIISKEFDGFFPNDYKELLTLKGVGKYTAAAISSFSFNLPYAVVDGNVYRVLSRFFNISLPIDSTEGKHYFEILANTLLDKNNPAAYNQAIMDLGANICTPKSPSCSTCFMSEKCSAYAQNTVYKLPVKNKKVKITNRFFHYFLLKHDNLYYVQKREYTDVWRNLYEFYLIEAEGNSVSESSEWINLQCYTNNSLDVIYQSKQRLTHQMIYSFFYVLELNHIPEILLGGKWIEKKNINNLGFPKTIVSFLSKFDYF